MNVAIYIRVSTDEQAQEGYSISAQKERLNAFCLSQNWTIVEYYIEDGQSAKDLNRPELNRLLNDSKQQRFNIVLVYRLDRLTRSVMDLYSLLQSFEEHNVKFKSATEVYDTTTAMGRLFITLVAALAQWERENLGERVRFGMEQMVMEGKRPGGPIPYGYGKDHEIVPEERLILRELRRLYMDGEGFYSIARKLNQTGKLKRGTEWSSYSVWYVLDNPYYAGMLRWGTKNDKGNYVNRRKEDQVACIIADGEHEPIFSKEEYQEQDNEMRRRSFKGHSKKNEYWFTGVMRCGRCGSSMTGRERVNKRKDGSKYQLFHYICANKQAGQGCSMPMFQQPLIEHLIMEHIRSIKLDYHELERLTDASIKSDPELEIAELAKELKKIKDRKKKWQYAFVEDLISSSELKERNEEENSKEKFINARLEEIKNEIEPLPTSITNNLMVELPEIWFHLSDLEKKQLIQTIFNKIEVDTPLEKALARKGKMIPAYIKSVEYN